jgi:hypothetical protein
MSAQPFHERTSQLGRIFVIIRYYWWPVRTYFIWTLHCWGVEKGGVFVLRLPYSRDIYESDCLTLILRKDLIYINGCTITVQI